MPFMECDKVCCAMKVELSISFYPKFFSEAITFVRF